MATMLLTRPLFEYDAPPEVPPARDDDSCVPDRYLLVDRGDAAGEAAALWLAGSGLLGARAEVTLLYVHAPGVFYQLTFDELVEWEPVDVVLRRESRAALQRLRRLLPLPASRVREVVRVGGVLQAVRGACDERPYRAVVVGGAVLGRFAFLRRDPARVLLGRLRDPLVVVPPCDGPLPLLDRASRGGRRALFGI